MNRLRKKCMMMGIFFTSFGLAAFMQGDNELTLNEVKDMAIDYAEEKHPQYDFAVQNVYYENDIDFWSVNIQGTDEKGESQTLFLEIPGDKKEVVNTISVNER